MGLMAPGVDAAADPDLPAAVAGDMGAFTRVVRRHQARVFSLALRLTGRREDAEELAQDTFLRLYANLDRIESPEHLRFWLCRTVTHRSIDRLRQAGRQVTALSMESAAEPAAEEDAADPLLQNRLRTLLLGLPEMPRAVLVLRYQEDLDPADIARVLDLPLNTVKSHLRRSLEWLRARHPEVMP